MSGALDSIMQQAPSIATFAGLCVVVWAAMRRQSHTDEDAAEVKAITTWRELAESRAAQIVELKAQLSAMSDRVATLEGQVAVLINEAAEMRRHDLSAVHALLTAMDAKIDGIVLHNTTIRPANAAHRASDNHDGAA